MPGFWQKFFNKKSNGAPTTAEFAAYTDKAIKLITSSHGQLEDEQLLTLFEINGIPAKDAVELLLFLPIAFCRHMIPQINWPAYYFEHVAEDNNLKVYYADNHRYAIIQNALQNYVANNFTQADYLKIAARSAAFQNINRLLLSNPGSEIAEIEVTAEYVVY